MSGLAWPWALAAVAVVLAGVVAAAVLLRRRRRAPADDPRWVAGTAELDELPAVRRALRRYAVLRGVGVACLGVAVVAAGVLVARPVDRETISERLGTRDIVLCLDVSGSMVPYDAAVLDSFTRMVERFEGERVALAVFNSTSRTVFPLTDDYPVVLDELEAGARALDGVRDGYAESYEALDRFLDFAAGAQGLDDEGSLIPDGLASCGLLFDEEGSERSRSIVLVTDNEVFGDPIYTLQEAAELTAGRGVTLYGLYGGAGYLRGSSMNAEFDQVLQGAGGRTWYADDPGAVDAILQDVMDDQAAVLDTDPEVRVTDRPRGWFVVLLLGVAGWLLVQWRVRS